MFIVVLNWARDQDEEPTDLDFLERESEEKKHDLTVDVM